MNYNQKWDVRGKTVEQVLAIADAAMGEIVDETQTNFIIDMQDDGHTIEDAEQIIENQRDEIAAWRKNALADLRVFLQRRAAELRDPHLNG